MSHSIIQLTEEPAGFGKESDDLNPQDFISKLPTQHTHINFECDDNGIYVGVWDTTAMQEVAGPYPFDEFMWLLEGQVDIVNTKTKKVETVHAGEAFIIPKGYECQWQQKAYLKKYFVISEGEETVVVEENFTGIIRPQNKVVESNRDNVNQFVFVTPPLIEKDNCCYKNSDDSFFAGTFESGAFEATMSIFPMNKLFILQSGRVVITDKNKKKFIFSEGDAFYIPQGTECQWRVKDKVRYYYVEQYF